MGSYISTPDDRIQMSKPTWHYSNPESVIRLDDAHTKSFDVHSPVLMAMVEQHILSKQQHAKSMSRQNEETSLQESFTNLSVEESKLECYPISPFIHESDLRSTVRSKTQRTKKIQ